MEIQAVPLSWFRDCYKKTDPFADIKHHVFSSVVLKVYVSCLCMYLFVLDLRPVLYC